MREIYPEDLAKKTSRPSFDIEEQYPEIKNCRMSFPWEEIAFYRVRSATRSERGSDLKPFRRRQLNSVRSIWKDNRILDTMSPFVLDFER